MLSRFGSLAVCVAVTTSGCYGAHERIADANVDVAIDPCALEDGEWTSVATRNPSSTDPACRAFGIPEWRVRSLQEVIIPNPCEGCDACDATRPSFPECSSTVTGTCPGGEHMTITARRISATEIHVVTRRIAASGLTCVVDSVATRLDR